MDTTNLNRFVTPQYGVHVDIIKQAKGLKKPIVLLCDIDSFITFICRNFSSLHPDDDLLLDDAALRRYEFAEYGKFRAVTMIILAGLRQNNIEIEFFNGLTTDIDETFTQTHWMSDTMIQYRVLRKTEVLLTSKNISSICRCFGLSNKKIPYPPLLIKQIHYAIQEAGSRLWLVDNHIDIWMAQIYISRQSHTSDNKSIFIQDNNPFRSLPPVFAILSNNWDFSLMKGTRLLLLDTFDVTRELHWLVKTVVAECPQFLHASGTSLQPDRLKEIIHLEGYLFTPIEVASMLHISLNFLIEIIILMGNRFTSSLLNKERPNCLPKPTSLEKIKQIETLFNNSCKLFIEDIPELQDYIMSHKNFLQAVRFSRLFYGYDNECHHLKRLLTKELCSHYIRWRLQKQISSDLKPIVSLNIMTLHNLCAENRLPYWMYSIYVKRIFLRCPKIEYIDGLPYGIDDILLELRKYLYGVICNNDLQPIVEYGRSETELYKEVSIIPHTVPNEMTLHSIFQTPNWNYNKAHSTIIELIKLIGTQFSCISDTFDNFNFIIIYLEVLKTLRFIPNNNEPYNQYDCFLKHELESLLVSMFACSSRYSQAFPTLVSCFSTSKQIIRTIYKDLNEEGFDMPGEDPLNLCGDITRQHCKYINRIGLNGLIPNFRSTVIFGWFQIIWSYIHDIFQLYYSPLLSDRSLLPQPTLLFNGDIFRWFYSAGAIQWRQQKQDYLERVLRPNDCLPTRIHSLVTRQGKCMRAMRSRILEALPVSSVKTILRRVYPDIGTNNLNQSYSNLTATY